MSEVSNRSWPNPAAETINRLQGLHRSARISKQLHRKVEGIELIRLKREQRTQSLCFSSRPLVLCGLPVRRLPSDQLLYERRNGKFVLQVTGHPDYGVPFGQDRIALLRSHMSRSLPSEVLGEICRASRISGYRDIALKIAECIFGEENGRLKLSPESSPD